MLCDSNFLFVDVEWEQLEKKATVYDRILQIGATIIGKETIYNRYIETGYRINNRIWKLLDLSKEQMDKGVSLEQAIGELQCYAGNVKTIVVWSQSTRWKLELLFGKYGCNKKTRNIIVLQDILTDIVGVKNSISFESALIAMKIGYDRRHVHNAALDAKSLMNLYMAVCKKYKDINPSIQNGIVKLKQSKIYHTKECSCVRGKSKDEISILDYMDFVNFIPCKRCIGKLNRLFLDIDSNDEIKRVKKIKGYQHKSVTSEQMYEIAKFFDLNISGNLKAATINTGYSLWQVFCNEKGYAIKLKHENYTVRGKSGKSFHNHEKFPKDIYSLFEYIFLHDEKSDIKPIADDLVRKQKIKDKQKKQQKARKMIEKDEWDEYYD